MLSYRFILFCLVLCQLSAEKPNIILILADDLGYGELGCYGQDKIKTPNIDSLAEGGMKFTQFYSGQTVCAPSRCSLLTGLHQGHAQVRNNSSKAQRSIIEKEVDDDFIGQWPLEKGTFTLGHMLQQQGYKTACVGKWGLGHPQNSGAPNKQGFDHFYGYICQVQAHNYYPRYLYRNHEKDYLEGNERGLTGPHYAADKMDDECLSFIRDNQDNPFFLYYASPIPHLALQVPDREMKTYEQLWEETPYQGKSYLPHDKPRAAYAAMVSHLDSFVGRMKSLLIDLKLDENTIIIFTSDNGPSYIGGYDRDFFNGSGGLRGRKGDLYEGGLRVPLLVEWPAKIEAELVSNHVASFWDFMVTLAELAEFDMPEGTDGVSFAPALFGNADGQEEHDHLYWEFPAYGGWQVLRQGDWKLVRRNLTNKKKNTLELYNLKDDLIEQNNLSEAYPEKVEEMLALMKRSHVTNPNFKIPELGDN